MTIYIANLHDSIDNEKLDQIFSSYGDVKSAEVVKDLFTNLSRGFGYVEMDDDVAQNVIERLDQTELSGLTITVKEAPPKKEQKGSYKVGRGAVSVNRPGKK